MTRLYCLLVLLVPLTLIGCKNSPPAPTTHKNCCPKETKASTCKCKGCEGKCEGAKCLCDPFTCMGKDGCGAECAGQTPKYVCPCPYCTCTQGDECSCGAGTCKTNKCKCGRPEEKK